VFLGACWLCLLCWRIIRDLQSKNKNGRQLTFFENISLTLCLSNRKPGPFFSSRSLGLLFLVLLNGAFVDAQVVGKNDLGDNEGREAGEHPVLRGVSPEGNHGGGIT